MNLLVHRISGRLSLQPPQRAVLEAPGQTVELASPTKGVGAARETVRAEVPTG